MGQARHPLSLLALAGVAVAVLAGGCGSSDEGSQSTTSEGGGAQTTTAPVGAAAQTCAVDKVGGVGRVRVSGVDCALARGVVATWDMKGACGAPRGGSRAACSVGAYRCLGAATERGLAVSCGAPGRSISFVAQRG